MRLKENLTLRQIGDDYVIVEPEQDMVDFSKVYSLNETAAFIWKGLQGKDFQLSDVVALILDHYEVSDISVSVVEGDAKLLISNFEAQGLIVR